MLSHAQLTLITNLRRELGLRPLSHKQVSHINTHVAHVMIQDMLAMKSTIGGRIHA